MTSWRAAVALILAASCNTEHPALVAYRATTGKPAPIGDVMVIDRSGAKTIAAIGKNTIQSMCQHGCRSTLGITGGS